MCIRDRSLTAAELGALGGNVPHVFIDDESGPVNATARNIQVTVSDEDGGSAVQSKTVTVRGVVGCKSADCRSAGCGVVGCRV